MPALSEGGQTNDAVCSSLGELRLEAVPAQLAQSVKAGSTAALVSTIEVEVIPRLMFAFKIRDHAAALGAGTPVKEPAAKILPTPKEVEELVQAILDPQTIEPMSLVARCHDRGVPLEQIYLGLLAPAARRLGVLWEDDECDFSSVTLGMWRLHKIIHEFSPAFMSEKRVSPSARRAMLAPAPGSQHTFGIIMVSEFFRRDGWDVQGGPNLSEDEILAMCKGQWLDLVGLSLGSECHISRVRGVIARIRQISLNPAVVVMVGGSICDGSSNLAADLGADAASNNATTALVTADELVKARASQSTY